VPVLAALAIDLPTPHPTHGKFTVALSLPGAQPARLEVVDAAGRRIWKEMLSAGAAGRNVQLRPPMSLRSGIYLVRLTQAGQTTSRKLGVVD